MSKNEKPTTEQDMVSVPRALLHQTYNALDGATAMLSTTMTVRAKYVGETVALVKSALFDALVSTSK